MESISSSAFLDTQQLDALFKQYHRSLLYFAKSMVRDQETAEELVADSFVKLWQRRDAFENGNKVKAFLYIATKNACLNHLKSAHARQAFEGDSLDVLQSVDPDSYAQIVRAELMQQIHDEVMKLSEKQREVFRLTFFEELDTHEIAERLGMTPTAIFANRSRAIEALRNIFKNKELWLCLFLLEELMRNVGIVKILVS
ncbi:RNA polymerase sigma factor [Parapedobacter soli]|uniref:RNA polymerase sigma factor n=1 Tax=Parapedobacter soli TaxID=416955 RepID=UPI0021C90A79|nr:RNA polymerase sigma-70 factor [Parapedobacter soli]